MLRLLQLECQSLTQCRRGEAVNGMGRGAFILRGRSWMN